MSAAEASELPEVSGSLENEPPQQAPASTEQETTSGTKKPTSFASAATLRERLGSVKNAAKTDESAADETDIAAISIPEPVGPEPVDNVISIDGQPFDAGSLSESFSTPDPVTTTDPPLGDDLLGDQSFAVGSLDDNGVESVLTDDFDMGFGVVEPLAATQPTVEIPDLISPTEPSVEVPEFGGLTTPEFGGLGAPNFRDSEELVGLDHSLSADTETPELNVPGRLEPAASGGEDPWAYMRPSDDEDVKSGGFLSRFRGSGKPKSKPKKEEVATTRALPAGVDTPICPNCGSEGQVDLHDPVAQRLHSSCTSCTHVWTASYDAPEI